MLTPSSSFPLKKVFIYLFICVCVSDMCMPVPEEAKRHLTSCSRNYRWSWAHWCGCWESNSNPLEGQHVLLTDEPPLQPPPLLFIPLRNMVDLRITPSQTDGAAELRAQSDAGFDLCNHSESQSIGLWAPLSCLWVSISAYGQDRGKEEAVLFRDFLIHCPQCPGPPRIHQINSPWETPASYHQYTTYH